MTETEKRQSQRLEFKEPVQYRMKEGDSFTGCVGHDIGEGGLRFNADDFIPLDTELSVNLELQPQKSVHLRGRVAWIQMIPHSERYQIGLKFEETESTTGSKKEVREYIQSHQAS